ncbi:MAG: PLAT/LH2 domain-containing protein, partial [Pseudomonadota bacterium]
VTDYGIKVFTGDVYQAGTNSKVQLTLNGSSQVIPNIELGKLIPGNPFERNQTDETGIYDQSRIGDLPSITINLEKGAKWFLGSIRIESPTLTPKIFPYNNWIEGGSPVTIKAIENRLSPTRKITFRNEAGFNTRMMIQYLENGPQGFPQPKFVFSSEMPFAQNSVIEIPANALNARVSLMGVGTVNNDFFSAGFDGFLGSDPCFKAWGTLFSPQGGTCDGKPVSSITTVKPFVLTTAEYEELCTDLATNRVPAGHTRLDVANIRKICKGAEATQKLDCYYDSTTKIGRDAAIAECTGEIPKGSSPNISTTVNTLGTNSNRNRPPPPPSIAENEQNCFNQVQGKVAYDTAGNKAWNENNIKNLCRGTTNPSATIGCFSSKMPQIGWAKASQECAATNISSQTQRVNQMPIPSQNQPTSLVLNLEGDWEMYNDKGVKFDKFAKIAQSGSNLSINNGYGANSTAVLNGNSFRTSDGLTGTISADGTKINWDINFVWVKQVSTLTTPNKTQVSPTTIGSTGSTLMPGQARDIDAKNGAVWIIGTNSVPGGYGIYKFNGSQWIPFDGGAVRIAVDNSGNPWVVNSEGTIFRRVNNAWTIIAGPNGATPLDIAISNSGEVWIVSDNGTVSRWTGSGWTNLIALSARRVIFTPNPDTFQIVDENGKRFVRQSGTSWIAATDASGMANKYSEFAVDGDGTKWGIDSSFNIWKLGGGQSQINGIVADTQLQPTSQITNAPPTPKRSITFRNEAGFVAKMMVQYFEAGPGCVLLPKFLFSDNIPVGQSKTLEIPNSAPNMQVTVSLIGSGTVKDNFYSTSLDAGFSGNRCFKAWGTLFSPQGGNCQ